MVGMVAEVAPGQWPEQVEEWTLELLDHLPDDNLRYELLDGTLLVSPAQTRLHQIVAANIFRRLDASIAGDHAVLFAPLDW
jgi:Uma2 family endonuclease